MAAWLENMLALQEVDMKIRNQNIRLSMLPKERQTIQGKIDAALQAFKRAKDSVQDLELRIKKCELEVKHLQEESLKLNQKSAGIRNNNEYRAILIEIDQNKKKIDALEIKQIELMEALDAARKTLRDQTRDANATVTMHKEELAEFVEIEDETKKRLADLLKQRPNLLNQLNPEVLSTYERLLKGGSMPLAQINDSSCGNCHLRITPQTLALAKTGRIAQCDNCGCFVYQED